MTVLQLPGGTWSSYAGAWGILALCVVALGMVLYLRFRGLRRELNQADLQAKDALKTLPRLSLVTRLQGLRWLVICVVLGGMLLGSIAVLLTQGFVAVAIGQGNLTLQYHTRSPVQLSWAHVRSLELHKRRMGRHLRIVIKTHAGAEYESIVASRGRENLLEMRRIYDELVAARARSQATRPSSNAATMPDPSDQRERRSHDRPWAGQS